MRLQPSESQVQGLKDPTGIRRRNCSLSEGKEASYSWGGQGRFSDTGGRESGNKSVGSSGGAAMGGGVMGTAMTAMTNDSQCWVRVVGEIGKGFPL